MPPLNVNRASLRICAAVSPAEIEAARVLFKEYAAGLQVDLCFQGFERELAGLPGQYAPPRGRLFIAWSEDEPVGCVALRPCGDSHCEMKRLFVKPAFQGRGLGQALAERVIADAKTLAYTKMVLDTLPSMLAALELYGRLGFVRRPAYSATPHPETIFMELAL